MAEGWARKYIRDKREELDGKLELVSKEYDPVESHSDIKRKISILQNVAISSVALDSSTVFTTRSTDSSCESITQQRKSVKLNAVKVMAADNVDISSYFPKTIDELFLNLNDKQSLHFSSFQLKTQGSADINTSMDPNFNLTDVDETNWEDNGKKKFSRSSFVASESLSDTDKKTLMEVDSNFNDRFDEEFLGEDNLKIDKLIVLCSCGDDLKNKLMSRSKSVEEWSIDAPTTASKLGEGDIAYHRVSLQIRHQVNILMEDLLMSAL